MVQLAVGYVYVSLESIITKIIISSSEKRNRDKLSSITSQEREILHHVLIHNIHYDEGLFWGFLAV